MKTPLNRVLGLSEIDATTKERLVQLRRSIDIVRLSEKIERLYKELNYAYERKLKGVNNEY